MSYYEPDDLPSGVSPFDAQKMGILPSDDRFTSYQKLNTYIAQENMQSNADFRREQDAALDASMQATSRHIPGADALFVQWLGLGKIKSTRHLAGFIEERRRKLRDARIRSTRTFALAAKIAWVLAACLFVIIALNIQFQHRTYNQVMYEYFIVRIGFLAALFCAWKCTKIVRDSLSDEEKDWTQQGHAMLRALEKNYSFKKKKESGYRNWYHLLDGYEVPSFDLTPRFVHDFNENYEKKAGKALPYCPYQFHTHYCGRLCLVYKEWNCAGADLEHGKLIDFADVLDVKLPPGTGVSGKKA